MGRTSGPGREEEVDLAASSLEVWQSLGAVCIDLAAPRAPSKSSRVVVACIRSGPGCKRVEWLQYSASERLDVASQRPLLVISVPSKAR